MPDMTRAEAWELLTEYNQDEFHLQHAQTVEKTMRYFAKELGYGEEEEFWGIVGLYMIWILKNIQKSIVSNLRKL